MNKLITTIVLLNIVFTICTSQIKYVDFHQEERKEIIFTYDSLTNIEERTQNNRNIEYKDYYKHLIGQKITSISTGDNPYIKSEGHKGYRALEWMDGINFYIDSVNYDNIDGYIFYLRNEKNVSGNFPITIDEHKAWSLDLAWVCNGYYEKIKELFLNKELVYIHRDQEYDLSPYSITDRFMDYTTNKNLTKIIPYNSIWKCTDVLVLPNEFTKIGLNRVVLNIENAQFGKYYIFVSELFKLKEYKKNKFLTMDDYHKYKATENKLLAEAKAKAAKAEEERKKADLERKIRIISTYGEYYGNLILKGKIIIGMNKEQCIEAIGRPYKINRTTTKSMIYEQWVYATKYLYFENGVLTTIQD
jgi:hypothetical protein